MKIYISADIEGVTTTTSWEETNPSQAAYARHADQMTKEVVAACEGALLAGATEIYVKDAHGGGQNIDVSQLPAQVTLLRNWTGHPYAMVDMIDSSFDACLFVGYHSAAGRCGNPLSHTFTGRHIYTKINGRPASEFMLYSYAAALESVPTVFLSGDRMLCDDYADLHPKLMTVAVKDGLGALTANLSPKKTLPMIKEQTCAALSQDFKGALPVMPENFDVEICFKEHGHAHKMSYFPGVRKLTDNIVEFSTGSYIEVLRTLMFIL